MREAKEQYEARRMQLRIMNMQRGQRGSGSSSSTTPAPVIRNGGAGSFYQGGQVEQRRVDGSEFDQSTQEFFQLFEHPDLTMTEEEVVALSVGDVDIDRQFRALSVSNVQPVAAVAAAGAPVAAVAAVQSDVAVPAAADAVFEDNISQPGKVQSAERFVRRGRPAKNAVSASELAAAGAELDASTSLDPTDDM